MLFLIFLFFSLKILKTKNTNVYYIFLFIFSRTKYVLRLAINHLNRQIYPLSYLFVVLRKVQSQRILTCFNLHNQFPYLHDQHLTDYEGIQTLCVPIIRIIIGMCYHHKAKYEFVIMNSHTLNPVSF